MLDAGKIVDREFKMSLIPLRSAAADAAFEKYNFGDCVSVEGFNGWDDTDTEDWIRVVYVHFDDDAPDADSHKVSFHVKFANEVSGVVEEAYALLVSNGGEIGHMPR